MQANISAQIGRPILTLAIWFKLEISPAGRKPKERGCAMPGSPKSVAASRPHCKGARCEHRSAGCARSMRSFFMGCRGETGPVYVGVAVSRISTEGTPMGTQTQWCRWCRLVFGCAGHSCSASCKTTRHRGPSESRLNLPNVTVSAPEIFRGR